MDERELCVLLARTPGLAARHVRAANGGAAELTASLPGLPPQARAFLKAPPRADLEHDLRWLDASGAVAVPCTSPLYPPLLAETADAPPVLFVLGDPRALSARQVAVVGARRATPAGCATAREIARDLAGSGLAVSSGLAVGIDAASHEGALDAGGPTLAVCAHGLDCIYPRRHGDLARRIRARGALVSRFPPGSPPTRRRFPWRNRMLSGMAAATLVVEAAHRSGSLQTAEAARRQGRLVFAVPGSVRDPLAAGCHDLLRRGARIAADAADVLQGLGITTVNQRLMENTAKPAAAGSAGGPLDTDSKILLDAVGFEPVSLNTLVERTGLPGGGIAAMLLLLELRGRVAPWPDGRWSRVS